MNVPSGYSALDLVGFTDKGDYSPSATYVKNDLVHYNDKIWKCLIDDTTGIVPTTGVNWDIWIDQSNSLDGLADVEITNAQDGQEITYDGTVQKWKNTSKIQTLTNQVKDMNNVLGSKNLLINKIKNATNNGISCLVSDDGVMSLSGTASDSNNAFFVLYIGTDLVPTTGDYVFYWGIATGSFSSYWINIHDYTDNTDINLTSNAYTTVTLTKGHNYRVSLFVFKSYAISGTLSISPMICLKSDWDLDPSYQPPAKTNQQLTQDTTALLDNLEVNGAVNMLPNTNATQVKYGITYTVNPDGTITADGKATSINGLYQDITLPKGTYKLSGCPSGGAQDKYYLAIASLNIYDYGDGAIFTLSKETTINVTIARINNTTTTYSGLTFKPMITVPSYNGDYVPYAKSNKELTEEVTPQEVAYTINSSVVSSNPRLKLYKTGKEIVSTGYIVTSAAAKNDTLFTITNERPKDDYEYFLLVNSSGGAYLTRFYSDGTVKLDTESMPASGYIVFGTLICK